MKRIPFDPKELTPIGEEPGFMPGMPGRPIFPTPITPRENYLMLLSGEVPLWMPAGMSDSTMMTCKLAENVARGFVFEAERIDNNTEAGGPDFFGVEWEYVPTVGGSMVRAGDPKVPDITHWEDYITFPDLDKVMDWEACAQRNKDFVNPKKVLNITILTGLFERLISFMDFENAAFALVDEDEQEGVHRLFDKLADFYDDYIDHYHRYLHPDVITLHDDWGSQRAPFFSLDVCMEMVAPYLKQIVDYCHEKGLWFQQHSCGKNELLVPAMIYAGVDMWQPQAMNDVEMLREKYGDKIMFSITPPAVPRDASDEDVDAAAKAFVDKYAPDFAEKPFLVGTFFADPRFTKAIYKYSRIALSK